MSVEWPGRVSFRRGDGVRRSRSRPRSRPVRGSERISRGSPFGEPAASPGLLALPRGARRRGCAPAAACCRAGGTGQGRTPCPGSPPPGSRGDGQGERDFVCSKSSKASVNFNLGAGSGVSWPVPAVRSPGVPKGSSVLQPSLSGPGCPEPAALCAPSSDHLCCLGKEEASPQHPERVPAPFVVPLGSASSHRLYPSNRTLSSAPRDERSPLRSPWRCLGCPPAFPSEKIKRKIVGFASKALIPAAPFFQRSHPSSPEHPL